MDDFLEVIDSEIRSLVGKDWKLSPRRHCLILRETLKGKPMDDYREQLRDGVGSAWPHDRYCDCHGCVERQERWLEDREDDEQKALIKRKEVWISLLYWAVGILSGLVVGLAIVGLG